MAAIPRVAVVGLGIWGRNHVLAYADYDRPVSAGHRSLILGAEILATDD